MNGVLDLPEIARLDTARDVVRIPPSQNVPLTPRVRALVDTAEFRRLDRIPQLGLVRLVYPGAHHTRFEHSLGVYRMALLFLRQLARDPRFQELVSARDAERFIAAALLHDLGHWPFCHPIEDMALPGVPQHEMFANSFLLEGEVADVLRETWQMAPREVVELLSSKPRAPGKRLLQSMLSGPVDVDKIDYLARDSLHAGVPYGCHFDPARLIGSLCVGQNGTRLAVTAKGRTAAELMVFARYVMFSEVYWHHAVRSATAMFQRAFYLLHGGLDLDRLFRCDEATFIHQLRASAEGGPADELLDGLFGPNRRLYKRVYQIHYLLERPLHQQLARRPYPELVACGEYLADRLSRIIRRRIAPHEILIDAPPVALEVQFRIDVRLEGNTFRPLEDVSPVVATLARRQFDDYVKQVRIFAAPSLAPTLREKVDWPRTLEAMIDAVCAD